MYLNAIITVKGASRILPGVQYVANLYEKLYGIEENLALGEVEGNQESPITSAVDFGFHSWRHYGVVQNKNQNSSILI